MLDCARGGGVDLLSCLCMNECVSILLCVCVCAKSTEWHSKSLSLAHSSLTVRMQGSDRLMIQRWDDSQIWGWEQPCPSTHTQPAGRCGALLLLLLLQQLITMDFTAQPKKTLHQTVVPLFHMAATVTPEANPPTGRAGTFLCSRPSPHLNCSNALLCNLTLSKLIWALNVLNK